MNSKIAEAIKCRYSPVAILFTDKKPEGKQCRRKLPQNRSMANFNGKKLVTKPEFP